MNPTIATLVAILIAAVCGVAAGYVIGNKMGAPAKEVLAAALAAVAQVLGTALGEPEIRAAARWAYAEVPSLSKFYTEENWIQFCLRNLPHAAELAGGAPAGLRGPS